MAAALVEAGGVRYTGNRVRHLEDTSDSAAQSRKRRMSEVLLVRCTRITTVNVGIDEAREDEQAVCVESLAAICDTTEFAHFDDLAVLTKDVGAPRTVCCHHRAAFDDKSHASTRLRREIGVGVELQ